MDTITAKNKSVTAENHSVEELLGEVANEFFQQLELGNHPDVEEYARKYPQIAEQIRLTFPALELVGGEFSSGSNPTLGAAALDHLSQHRLGDFQIVRELGRGGMGVVYEAQQISMGRQVALKVLPFAALANEMPLRRFKNEVRAVATLQHPNIVTVYSIGEERGVHYYAMQLIRGRSLAETIEQLASLKNDPQPLDGDSISRLLDSSDSDSGAVSAASGDAPTVDHLGATVERETEASTDVKKTDPEMQAGISTLPATAPTREYYRSAAKLGIQAASALAHAHENGVIHRDVKPANLLLDVSGNVYLTDFGLARIEADAGVTMAGQLLGTLRYMSPEQAMTKQAMIDHRSDIYSLGLTLYELLALRPAFGSKSRQEILAQIAFEEPTKLRRLVRSIPAELETIIGKAIEKSPEDRYASAGELADDLRAFLEDRPITARPPTLVQRLSKWSRRNRGLVAAGAAAGCICLVLLVVSNILVAGQKALAEKAAAGERTQRQTAERERDAAQQARDQAEDVTTFLLAAFGSPDPERDGHTVTVVEVLDRAVETLESRQEMDSLRKAALLDAIGKTYLGLELGQEAIPLCEEVRTIYQEQLGERDPKTLKSMNDLAGAYGSAGRLAEAVGLDKQTLKLRQEVLGDRHPETLASMHNLAIAYGSAGRFAEALDLHEQTLSLMREVLGDRHPNTLVSMQSVAVGCRLVGRFNDAVALLEETLERDRAELGERHYSTLSTMNSLAVAYEQAGRYEEGRKLHEQTLSLSQEVLGDRHRFTLNSMHNMAQAYEQVGRNAEALKLHEQTLSLRQEVLGDQHPDTLFSMHTLALAFKQVGRNEEGLELHEQTLGLRKDVLGDRHPDTLISMHTLAVAYNQVGRNAEAIELLEKTLELMRAELGERHPGTLNTMKSLAVVYGAVTRNEQAVGLLEETLKLVRAELGERHPGTLDTTISLAVAYGAVARYEEALELHEKTRSLMREVLGPWHPSTLTSMSYRASAYRKAGRFAEAGKLYDEAIEFLQNPPAGMKQDLDEIAKKYASVLAGAAETNLLLKQPEKAESLARESLELHERLTPEHWRRFHAQSLLGMALLLQAKPDEAEQHLLDGFAGMQSRKETMPASERVRLREACQSLVDLYQSQGNTEQTERWTQTLVELERAAGG
jgi:eukaryotic-like serine/threonine-protein kinase